MRKDINTHQGIPDRGPDGTQSWATGQPLSCWLTQPAQFRSVISEIFS